MSQHEVNNEVLIVKTFLHSHLRSATTSAVWDVKCTDYDSERSGWPRSLYV